MSQNHSRIELLNFNQKRRDAWVAEIAAHLSPGTRILDVGAGTCQYRSLFKHCDYKAQDFGGYQGTVEGLLKQEWNYGQLDYVCDAAAIPAPDGSFDAVLCTEVLEHVPEPIRVLKEIGRILRIGGRAFISAPLGSGLHQQPYHYYGGFTPHFYRRFLPECGMGVVSIEPNGRFFRLLMQEIHRGINIVHTHRHNAPWQPIFWLWRGMFDFVMAPWLARLDDAIPVEEFTVGYHVEAIKLES